MKHFTTPIHVHIFLTNLFMLHPIYIHTFFGRLLFLHTHKYTYLKNTSTLPIQTLCKALHAIFIHIMQGIFMLYIYSYFARHFILHIYIYTYYRRAFSCYLSARHSSWGSKLWILVKKLLEHILILMHLLHSKPET